MNEWGVAVSLIGVWGWIGSTLMFIFHGFPVRGQFQGRQASVWGAASLAFFSCWIAGMLVA